MNADHTYFYAKRMCTESKLMKFVFVWPVFFYISISISCSVLFLLFFLSICAVTARYFRTVMCGKHTMSRPAVQCYLKHLNYYKWTFKAGFACFHKWKVLLGTVIFFYYCIFVLGEKNCSNLAHPHTHTIAHTIENGYISLLHMMSF